MAPRNKKHASSRIRDDKSSSILNYFARLDPSQKKNAPQSASPVPPRNGESSFTSGQTRNDSPSGNFMKYKVASHSQTHDGIEPEPASLMHKNSGEDAWDQKCYNTPSALKHVLDSVHSQLDNGFMTEPSKLGSRKSTSGQDCTDADSFPGSFAYLQSHPESTAAKPLTQLGYPAATEKPDLTEGAIKELEMVAELLRARPDPELMDNPTPFVRMLERRIEKIAADPWMSNVESLAILRASTPLEWASKIAAHTPLCIQEWFLQDTAPEDWSDLDWFDSPSFGVYGCLVDRKSAYVGSGTSNQSGGGTRKRRNDRRATTSR